MSAKGAVFGEGEGSMAMHGTELQVVMKLGFSDIIINETLKS